MKPSILVSILLLGAANLASAQQQQQQQQQPPRWSLGLGSAVSDGVYAGEGNRITPFPLLSYEGERFFWRGISGGAHLLKTREFSLDATLSARFDGMDRDDFGTAELAERGINRALLADRDDGLDLGMALAWRGAAGQLSLAVKADISGASKGAETTLQYAYPIQWGATRVSPNIGVTHLSKKMANYYYGTLPEEVARGVRDYKPGSAALPRIGVDVLRPFAQRWVFIGNLSYQKLPGKISDSPLLEKDTDGKVSAFIGVARGF